MRHDFSAAIDQELASNDQAGKRTLGDNNNPSVSDMKTKDDLKQKIKADFDDQVIKPFRKDALKIVQGEVDAFNAGYSLKKRNGGISSYLDQIKRKLYPGAKKNYGPPEKSGRGFFKGIKKRFVSLSKRLMRIFNSLMERFGSASTLGKAGYAAVGILSVTVLVWWLRALFIEKETEEIYE
jgi:hypothetical protein